METNYYRNFLAIVEAGNMTTAAELLHITQPTLSKQLQLLEKKYEANLLITKRGSRSVLLTDAGKALYKRAKEICALEDLVKEEVISTTNTVRGPLRFSISQGRSDRFIKRALSQFHKKYPEVTFELYEGIVTTQQEQLISGLSDLGVCSTELTQPEKFDILYTHEEKLALIASSKFKHFPLSGQITVDDLKGIPLAISGDCAIMLRQKLNNLTDELNIISISTTECSALAWVETGEVAAITPLEMGEVISPDYQVAYLSKEFDIRNSIITPTNRPLSYAADMFLDFYKTLNITGMATLDIK